MTTATVRRGSPGSTAARGSQSFSGPTKRAMGRIVAGGARLPWGGRGGGGCLSGAARRRAEQRGRDRGFVDSASWGSSAAWWPCWRWPPPWAPRREWPLPPPATSVRNPGDPYYEARLRAGQGGRVWTGRINISFTNLEAAPLGTIYLRLWSNGVDGCDADAIEIWDLTGGSLGIARSRLHRGPRHPHQGPGPGGAGDHLHAPAHHPPPAQRPLRLRRGPGPGGHRPAHPRSPRRPGLAPRRLRGPGGVASTR